MAAGDSAGILFRMRVEGANQAGQEIGKVTTTLANIEQAIQPAVQGFLAFEQAALKAEEAAKTFGNNTDAAITQMANQIATAMSASQDSFEETVRTYQTELLALSRAVKAGSVDYEDYQRRLALLPPSLQEAAEAADGLGKNLKKSSSGVKSFQQELKDLEKAQKDQGTALERMAESAGLSAQQFQNLKVGATVAVTAITAIAAVAATASAAIWALAKSTGEYGSKIFNASQQTGASAQTLNALKFAADQSGSSLDEATNSLAKFNVLLGEANQGTEKAADTLKLYGITARDVDGALVQAIATIAKMTSADQQAAAAKHLFKDETAAILPLIKSFNGDLPGLIDKVEKLGLAMSDDAARGAKEFNTSLKTLEAQAAATGRAFAGEFLPELTYAMRSGSREISSHQSVAVYWGNVVGDIISGMGTSYRTLSGIVSGHLAIINQALRLNISTTVDWANVVLANLGIVGQALAALRVIGQTTGGVLGSVGGTVSIPTGGGIVPRAAGGGRGGGGGGASPKDDAEKKRQEAVRAAERAMRQELAILAAGYKEEVALQEQALSLKGINEAEHQGNLGKIRKNALENHKQLLKNFLELAILNAEEREEAEHKIALLDKELATERIETATKVYEVIKSLTEKETKDFEDAQEKRRRAERKRANDRARLEVDPSGEMQRRKKAENAANVSILGDSVLSVRNDFGDLTDTISPMLPALQLAGDALAGLAQGIGNVVQNFILMGSAGPQAMKKLVASVLAGVAAQAAVIAVMELAYGIAALTPWGFAIYGDPTKHFQAAALMGSVAVATGLAGRAVAGNSFSQATGGASGGRGVQEPPKPDAFTTSAANPFGENSAFGRMIQTALDRQAATIDRAVMVIAQAEETNHQLAQRLEGISPGEVVRMGAGDAREAISEAVSDDLADRGAASAGPLMRNLGWM